MVTKKDILKIFFVLIALVGSIAGVTLIQQRQDIREKAAGSLTCAEQGGSCMDGGCPQGYSDLGRLNCNAGSKCCKREAATPPPGGGGGGNQAGCSSASANKCQGKNPGDSCGSGKKCVATSQKGNDGKPKCSCQSSGGGGGGGNTSCDKNPNPTILKISDSGEVLISFASFLTSTPPKIALKKNSQTCNLNEYDKIIDTKGFTSSDMPIRTGIQVKSGDSLCIYGEDIGTDAGPYPFEGWIEPKNNSCNGQDISSLVQSAQNSTKKIISQQCWGDYAKKADCDFDDYAIVVGIANDNAQGYMINLLFRQQGITSSVTSGIDSQLETSITLKKDGNIVYQINTKPMVDPSGIWVASFSTNSNNDQSVPPGTYDILVKGISHLQKKFTNIEIGNNGSTIDKSTDTKDELKAGDVNNDNAITIEDISTVLRYYTDFKVKVDKNNKEMVQSDINKDGFITIDDVALIALNWSDFTVKGDE